MSCQSHRTAPENGGSVFLQNTSIYLQVTTQKTNIYSLQVLLSYCLLILVASASCFPSKRKNEFNEAE